MPIATKFRTAPTDAICHVWTAPGWHEEASRRFGRCCHVFGLFRGSHDRWPIMPSADQLPVNSSHSTMRWHKRVVLIAGSTGSALRVVRPPNLPITPDARRDLVYRASTTGFLYRSPLAIMAQAIRHLVGKRNGGNLGQAPA